MAKQIEIFCAPVGVEEPVFYQLMRRGAFDCWFAAIQKAAAEWDGTDPIRDAKPLMVAALGLLAVMEVNFVTVSHKTPCERSAKAGARARNGNYFSHSSASRNLTQQITFAIRLTMFRDSYCATEYTFEHWPPRHGEPNEEGFLRFGLRRRST